MAKSWRKEDRGQRKAKAWQYNAGRVAQRTGQSRGMARCNVEQSREKTKCMAGQRVGHSKTSRKAGKGGERHGEGQGRKESGAVQRQGRVENRTRAERRTMQKARQRAVRGKAGHRMARRGMSCQGTVNCKVGKAESRQR